MPISQKAQTDESENPFSHLPEEFQSDKIVISDQLIPEKTEFATCKGFPKTDSGYWMLPTVIFKRHRMDGAVPGEDCLGPPPGWLHLWCNLSNGPSPTYPRPLDWKNMCLLRTDYTIPLLVEKLKKLWTPPQEIEQRKKECINVFAIAKAKEDASIEPCQIESKDSEA